MWAALTEAESGAAHKAHSERQTTTRRAAKRLRPKHLMFVVQVRHALMWVQSLLEGTVSTAAGQGVILEKWFSAALRLPGAEIAIRTDASPFGHGSVLIVNGLPRMWIAEAWDEADLRRYGASRGDPA